MTNPTVSRGLLLLLIAPRDRDKSGPRKRHIATDYFKMSFMREMYRELTGRISSLL